LRSSGVAALIWTPPLADGTTGPATNASSGSEVGFNADVQPLPSVSSISPSSGTTAGATTVTITGQNLEGTTAVQFGATPAASFTVLSDTTITAVAPSGSAEAVDVTVRNPGQSPATAADRFTYVTPTPAIASIWPSRGPSTGGTTVTIAGHDLSGASAVNFGSVPARSFTINSASSITAVSPPAAAGPVDVSVTTASGRSPSSSADQFTYVIPTPRIASVSPSRGPRTGGTRVTITGRDFSGASAVSFGSRRARSFTVNSASRITAIAPAGPAGTIDLSVRTAGGPSPSTTADRFTFQQVCVVPKLKGKSLKAARQALQRAHCTLGKVTGPTNTNARITKQTPKPGTILIAGSGKVTVATKPPR
jgi:IPT/TIG domain/PASTA domain